MHAMRQVASPCRGEADARSCCKFLPCRTALLFLLFWPCSRDGKTALFGGCLAEVPSGPILAEVPSGPQ